MHGFLRDLGLLLLLLAAAFLHLSPLLEGDFLTDDFHVLRFVTYGPESSAEFDPEDPTEVFRYFALRATERYELYRPLVAIAVRASYELHGTDARGFLLENILLHLLGAALVFALARTMLPERGPWLALLATAIFLFHPLQTQVIAWTAARSDSFCWIFGGASLLLRLRRPQQLVLPHLLAVCALLSKESGVVFLAIQGLFELCAYGAPDRRTLARTLRTLLAPALLLLYLFVRSLVFGGDLTDTTYGSNAVTDRLAFGLDSLRESLLTALAPVPSMLFEQDWLRIGLQWIVGAAQIALLIVGLREMARRGLLTTLVVLALLLVPFVMAGLVSRLADDFVNTRGCYTSIAAASLLVVAACRNRRLIPAVAVVLLYSLPAGAMLERDYVATGQGLRRLLDGCRGALATIQPAGERRVAILNFHHVDWFRGGFGLAGGLDPSLKRPFTPVDWETFKVSGRSAVPEHPSETAMKELFAGPRGDLSLIEMKQERAGEPFRFRAVLPVEPVEDLPISITALYPPPGATSTLDSAMPETLVPRYRVRHAGPVAQTYRLLLYDRTGRVVDTKGHVADVVQRGDDVEIHIELPPLPPHLADEHDESREYVWCIRAETAEGAGIARSPLLLNVVRRGRP